MDPPGPPDDAPPPSGRGPEWEPPDVPPPPGAAPPPAASRGRGPAAPGSGPGPGGGTDGSGEDGTGAAGRGIHPMGLGDVLDGAFRLYRADARLILAVTAAFLVPLQLALSLMTGTIVSSAVQFVVGGGDAASAAATAVLGVGVVLLTLVVTLAAGAVSLVAARRYLGRQSSVGETMAAVARRAWALVAAWVLVHVVETIGFLLCIVPGFLAMALFVAVTPVIMLEGLGPVAAMRRSAQLMRRRLWPVLGIALLSGLLAAVVNIALATPAAVVGVAVPGGWVFETGWTIALDVVVTPFTVIVATLLYFDGRVRSEGLDLSLMADEVARRSRP